MIPATVKVNKEVRCSEDKGVAFSKALQYSVTWETAPSVQEAKGEVKGPHDKSPGWVTESRH